MLSPCFNIYFDVYLCVVFILYIQIARIFFFNLFLDFQKLSTTDIELCDICYTLLCECIIMKIQHKQQQGKDL